MKIKASLSIVAFIVLFSCKTRQMLHPSTPGNELFKVAVLYPNGEGKTFDMSYYENNHMPMVAGFLGKNLRFYEIDKVLAGRTPNEKVPYLAIGYFYVKDVDEYNKAIGQNRDAVISDFKHYTNIQPVILISEVRKIGYADKK
jgi:uncharacterized protein (TIGR02118 family)